MNKTTKTDTLFQMGRISRKLFSARPHGEHRTMGHGPAGHSPTGHSPVGRGPMSSIGRTQGMILDNIINNPDISQDELAAKLQLDKTTIAKAVKKMEISGMITREKSTEDARKYKLKATEKAAEITEYISKIREERSQLAFEGIDTEEIEAFKSTLNKIEENIETNRAKMRNGKFAYAREVVSLLLESDGLTKNELFQKLDMETQEFESLLERLTKRSLVEDVDGKLFATDKAKDMKENGQHKRMRHPHRGHGRRAGGRGMRNPRE